MSSAAVALDFGSSLNRGVYVGEGKHEAPKLIAFPPYSLKVKESTINSIKERALGVTSNRPETAAWLRVNNEWYVVGELAKNERCAELCLEARKFIAAEPITLATVGAIAKRHLFANEFSIKLGILLPWSEYQDRAKYEQYITDSLSCFEFQGTEYRVTVDDFKCLPEGSGLFAKGRQQKQGRLVNVGEITILVVVVGYRNISLLFLEKGNLSRGYTADYGMSWMVERVKQRTSGYKDEQLIQAIAKAGPNINQKALDPLVDALPPRMRADELQCLTAAFTASRTEYVNVLAEWMQPKINVPINEVVASGGTFHSFKSELMPLLRELTKCTPSYGQGLEQRIIQQFGNGIRREALHSRLADVYGFFYLLKGGRLPALRGADSEGRKAS